MPDDAGAVFKITGGRRLSGTATVGGAKNAALPCLFAALLTDQPCRITRVPQITDVDHLCRLLTAFGLGVSRDHGAVEIHAPATSQLAEYPPDDLVGRIRGSFLIMGAVLARRGRAVCAHPGGDAIGERPVGIHTAGFQALGAQISDQHGRTVAAAPDGLRGADILLDYPTVLGTENLILAAALAQGRSRLINAAMEPEIVDLADMLNAMGAQIGGAGTPIITIDGVERLGGVEHRIIPDRIEAGTVALAAAITAGDVRLVDIVPAHLDALWLKLRQLGVRVDLGPDSARIRSDGRFRAADIQAVPYPGLPTDLQPPLSALLTQADGDSVVHERVFEDRVQHFDELARLGARISEVENAPNPRAVRRVHGPSPLRGANVRGRDVRAVAALVVAALAAAGQTRVAGVEHLDRAYASLESILASLGADIQRVHRIPSGGGAPDGPNPAER